MQYLEEKRKEYVGYNDKSIHLLLDHVQTWAIITNKGEIEAKAHFHTSWSDSPTNTSLYTPANWTDASGTASE